MQKRGHAPAMCEVPVLCPSRSLELNSMEKAELAVRCAECGPPRCLECDVVLNWRDPLSVHLCKVCELAAESAAVAAAEVTAAAAAAPHQVGTDIMV